MLSDGFATSAAGFSQTDNSFVPGADQFAGFMPQGWGMSAGSFDRGSNLMSGGLGDDFAGAGLLFDLDHDDFDSGPFKPRDSSNCSFSQSTGRVTCPPRTVDGLRITRSFAFTDTSGKAQSAPNRATNTVNTQVIVTGTIVTHDKKDTTTVNHSSDQTVSGLVKTATKRIVNGKSGGTELTDGTNAKATKFTTTRMQGDTTVGLTIPIENHKTSYPIAGTVTRSMKVTVKVAGQPDATSTRREVITYDGSATAKVVITQDGTTKNCTLPLPHGHLTCS